jgi:hypothetical protein
MTCSTQQAAKRIGIHWVTLHRWLAAKKIRPSVAVPIDGGRTLWRWTEKDIAKLEKLKQGTYRKGRGRKLKAPKSIGPKGVFPSRLQPIDCIEETLAVWS